MPRVIKQPDIRRAELLDRASGLFLRHGYDNVSLNDLIADAIFDTFDPEGVADMIYGLAARTNTNILDVSRAADRSARDLAIDGLTTRFRLHGLAIDRILGLPDGSITTFTRAQVEAMVAALPRSY